MYTVTGFIANPWKTFSEVNLSKTGTLYVGMIPTINSNKFRQNTKLLMNPPEMVNYLTSFKDYTIITHGEQNKILEEKMQQHNMNVYYVNIENLLDKEDIALFLKNKYRNMYSDDDIWVFHRGFYLGSGEDILDLINRKTIK
jgi:hypothetical protein